jgi:hypothetical protein
MNCLSILGSFLYKSAENLNPSHSDKMINGQTIAGGQTLSMWGSNFHWMTLRLDIVTYPKCGTKINIVGEYKPGIFGD